MREREERKREGRRKGGRKRRGEREWRVGERESYFSVLKKETIFLFPIGCSAKAHTTDYVGLDVFVSSATELRV